MTESKPHTPSLPWLEPRTDSTYMCASGRIHYDDDACTCTPRSP